MVNLYNTEQVYSRTREIRRFRREAEEEFCSIRGIFQENTSRSDEEVVTREGFRRVVTPVSEAKSSKWRYGGEKKENRRRVGSEPCRV